MKKIIKFGMMAGLLLTSAFSQAKDGRWRFSQGDGSTSTNIKMPWEDYHNQNRAIAFGSIIMEKNGSNINNWKAVNADNFCVVADNTQPIPDNGNHHKTDDSDSGDSNNGSISDQCLWEVLYTTHYDFIECPDGQAFIARSGEGIDLKSKIAGDIFAWAEMIGCGDDPFPNGRGDALNKNRKLDFMKIKRTYN